MSSDAAQKKTRAAAAVPASAARGLRFDGSPAAQRRLRALLAAMIPLALFLLSLCVFGIRYDTNDDAILAEIAAGAYGSDTIHLVYVNLLFGCLLRPLYWLAGSVNWFAIVQMVLVLCSLAVLFRLGMEHFGTARGAVLCTAVLLLIGPNLFYMFQYVKNSAVCLTAGLALLADNLGYWNRRTAAGLALALLGSMLRFDNFFAVGALAACLLLARFAALDRPAKKRAAAAMVLLFALVFGAKGADALAYQLDDGWRAFTAYNAARTAFSDYKEQLLDANRNTLAAAGVSDSEYNMLQYWDYYDHTYFPQQRIASLAAAVPARSLRTALRALPAALAGVLYGEMYRAALALTVLCGLVLLRKNRQFAAFLGTGAVFGALLFYLVWKDRFPQRVEVSLLGACTVFALGCAARCAPAMRPRRWMTAACAVFFAVVFAVGIQGQYERSRQYWVQFADEKTRTEGAFENKDCLYLVPTRLTNLMTGQDIWHPRTDNYYSNVLILGGWLSHSPSREALLQQYGLESPLCDAVNRADICISDYDPEIMLAYVREKTGDDSIAFSYDTGDPMCPCHLVSGAGGGSGA